MNANATSSVSKFRSSPRAQRIGSAILAGITVAYLVLITYSFSDRLQSTRNIIVFVLLLSLGVVALVLLSRPWRNTLRRLQRQSQDPE
jgi:formate hydrogenlyase subunit 4